VEDAENYAKECRERYDLEYAGLDGMSDTATTTDLTRKRKAAVLDDEDMAYEAYMQSLEDTTLDATHKLDKYLNQKRETRDGNRSVPLGMGSIPIPTLSVSGPNKCQTDPIYRKKGPYRIGTDNFRDS
jgi:hypothetical protein